MEQNAPDRFAIVDPIKMVYRSGQPTHEQLEELYKMGIRNVINLRRKIENPIGNYNEQTSCGTLSIKYYSFAHFGFLGMTPETIDEIVDAIRNTEGPVLVHCKHGRDRTSTIIAAYLVKYCDKDPELAWTEDAVGYDHDENTMFCSNFKPSFFGYCDYLKNKKRNEKKNDENKEEI